MKKTSSRTFSLALILLATISSVSAQADAVKGFTKLADIIDAVTGSVVKALGSLFMAAAVVAFFYGVVQYIWSVRDGKPDGVKAGQQFMIWSLVGLFAMFSVYGIVTWGQDLFGIKESSRTISIPEIKLQRSVGGSGSSNNGGSDPLGGSKPSNNGGGGSGSLDSSSPSNNGGDQVTGGSSARERSMVSTCEGITDMSTCESSMIAGDLPCNWILTEAGNCTSD